MSMKAKSHYHWQMCILILIAFAFLFSYIYQGIDAIQNEIKFLEARQNKVSDIRSLLGNSRMTLNCTEWSTSKTYTNAWLDNCCVRIDIQNYVTNNNRVCYDFIQHDRTKGVYNITFGDNVIGSIDAEKCFNTQKYAERCMKWEIVEE